MDCPNCNKSYLMCVDLKQQEEYELHQCQNKDCNEVVRVYGDGSTDYDEEDENQNLSDF